MDGQTAEGRNPYLMTLEEWRARHGMGLQAYFQLLADLDGKRPAPALCTEGCEVPPRQVWCSHGCPSLPVALELE